MAGFKGKRKIVKPTETILDTEKFMFKEEKKEEEVSGDKIVIDYTLKPQADNGLAALLISGAGTIWFISMWVILYRANGNESMPAASCAACGIACALAAVYVSIKGFKEKDRNHTLCWVSVILAGLQLIAWIITLLLTAKI